MPPLWDHSGRANRRVQGEHPMATVALEERVAVLEAEGAQLQRERQSATKRLLPWWERRLPSSTVRGYRRPRLARVPCVAHVRSDDAGCSLGGLQGVKAWQDLESCAVR